MYQNYVSFNKNHVKKNGLHVHGDLKMRDIFAFVIHLSKEIQNFVMEQLRVGLIVFQIWQNIGNM
jgi:hypothetical protein